MQTSYISFISQIKLITGESGLAKNGAKMKARRQKNVGREISGSLLPMKDRQRLLPASGLRRRTPRGRRASARARAKRHRRGNKARGARSHDRSLTEIRGSLATRTRPSARSYLSSFQVASRSRARTYTITLRREVTLFVAGRRREVSEIQNFRYKLHTGGQSLPSVRFRNRGVP